MENTIYRVDNFDGNHTLEIHICDTNELNPYRDIKEIGIVVLNREGLQLNVSIDENELESLIEYLRNAQRHIDNFNRNSKPKDE